MSAKKYEISNFTYYDSEGIKVHLAKRAKEGYLLKSINQMFWVYEKIEPRDLIFEVVYLPFVDSYDPNDTDEELIYRDFCTEQGYTFVTNLFQMQIFYTENKNAVPIETEESIKLENIHQTMKKNLIKADCILFIGLIFFMGIIIWGFINKPLTMLASNEILIALVFVIVFLIGVMVSVCKYYQWYNKSRKNIKIGKPCEKVKSMNTKKSTLIFVISTVIIILLIVLVKDFSIIRLCSYIFAMIALTYMKRKQFQAGVTRITVIVILIAGSILSENITENSFINTSNDDMDVYNEMPLTLDNFTDFEYTDHYFFELENEQSFFLDYLRTAEGDREEMDFVTRNKDFDLAYANVKVGFLFNFVLSQMLNDVAKLITDDAFGADLVYYYQTYEMGRHDTKGYVLVYGNEIYKITYSYFELTEQMKIDIKNQILT